MKSFVFALIAACTSAEVMLTEEFEFMKFISTWNKSYGTREEYKFRFAQWLEMEIFIQEVNAPGSGHTHVAGHNAFSDMTRDEYRKMLGLRNMNMEDETELFTPPDVYAEPNGSKDWRDGNCVTPVKNQEQCGSCWAFSATETVESAYCLAGNDLKVLSPQQLVDCAGGSYKNKGCNGGWYYWAWNYLTSHGQELESNYPYTGKDGSCAYSESLGVAKTTSGGTQVGVSGGIFNKHYDTSAIMAAIDEQPVSVAVAADSQVFQSYKSGVLSSSSCGTRLDHAIAAEGYDSTAETPYFIVRNSWGRVWGEQGYVKIAITAGKGTCGVNQKVWKVGATSA